MNRRKLAGLIVENGLTQKEIAEKIGITSKTFYNKMKKGVFGTDEVMKMVQILNIQNPIDIFLANE